MFGLYPAGPQWIKFFSSTVDARALQRSLVDDAGFTAGIFHQPFGTQRGFAVAQRERFLVLADSLERAEPELWLFRRSDTARSTGSIWTITRGAGVALAVTMHR